MNRGRLAAMLGVTVLAWAAGVAGQVRPVSDIASVPRTSVAELKQLLEKDAVIVLDVRSPREYGIGHIAGAILVPLETVSQRAGEWKDATKPIVTYCTWPAEQTSARAALTLLQAGVKDVRALRGGFAAWVPSGQVVQGTNPK